MTEVIIRVEPPDGALELLMKLRATLGPAGGEGVAADVLVCAASNFLAQSIGIAAATLGMSQHEAMEWFRKSTESLWPFKPCTSFSMAMPRRRQ